MNNVEQKQEKHDAGEVKHFTRTPNMLIFGYKTLSTQEKWLYVCLKHLCGKRGTRHLSLRYIAQQTGISVGALSRSKNKQGVVNEGMLRHLQDAGLIHAEIKKHEGRGNAHYHITITDIWALNQSFFEETKTYSDFGQEESSPVHISDEPVRNSNKSVQFSDSPVRNSDEPVRKPLQYQEREKITDKTCSKTREIRHRCETSNKSESSALASQLPTRISHPEHSFIWFDDLMAPSVMVVRLTPAFPHHHSSEVEDKRRERIACWEVRPFLEQQGLNVTLHWEHETENETVEAVNDDASTESSSAVDRPIVDGDEQEAGRPSASDRHTMLLTPGSTHMENEQLSTSLGTSPHKRAKAKKAVLTSQVEGCFDVLDQVRQEVEHGSHVTYTRSKVAREYLADLVKANEYHPENVAPEMLRIAWLELWNRPVDPKTGFDWKTNLTIKAFCNNFDSALACALRKDRKGKQRLAQEEHQYSLATLLAEQNPGFFE